MLNQLAAHDRTQHMIKSGQNPSYQRLQRGSNCQGHQSVRWTSALALPIHLQQFADRWFSTWKHHFGWLQRMRQSNTQNILRTPSAAVVFCPFQNHKITSLTNTKRRRVREKQQLTQLPLWLPTKDWYIACLVLSLRNGKELNIDPPTNIFADRIFVCIAISKCFVPNNREGPWTIHQRTGKTQKYSASLFSRAVIVIWHPDQQFS